MAIRLAYRVSFIHSSKGKFCLIRRHKKKKEPDTISTNVGMKKKKKKYKKRCMKRCNEKTLFALSSLWVL
jgi:PHP family Zn ribbon phosphoesterase